MANPSIKVMLTGESCVGKKSLLMTYIDGKFPAGLFTTLNADSRRLISCVDDRLVTTWIWVTAGGERLHTLRQSYYPATNVFLLCFDIGNRSSFENLHQVFIPEIRQVCRDVPIILVGCKADLRNTTPSYCVPKAEIERKSEEWKMAAYFETSAMFNAGLFMMMKQCIRIGLHHYTKTNKPHHSLTTGRPQPPTMPLEEPLPTIQIESSSFADDWLATLKDQLDTDILFVLGSGTEIRAHKIVLCAASSFFADVIHLGEMISCAKHPGISSIRESRDDRRCSSLIIALDSDIEDQTFKYCLQFIYSGLPCMEINDGPGEIAKLKFLSQLWQIVMLETMCVNMENEESHLNPSVGVLHNSEMGEKLRCEFLQTRKWADVTFTVEGQEVSAHRIILCARCRVFSAMLNENFQEGASRTSIAIPNTTHETFLALLEYLYSDHAPISEGDPVGILVLANQFCLLRLINMAEYCVAKELESALTDKCTEDIDIDVVDIMENSKDHNSKQLPNWCLHLIAKNYAFFKSRQEFSRLTGDDLLFVEEHQWPPISYLQELAEYEAECARAHVKARRKCIIM